MTVFVWKWCLWLNSEYNWHVVWTLFGAPSHAVKCWRYSVRRYLLCLVWYSSECVCVWCYVVRIVDDVGYQCVIISLWASECRMCVHITCEYGILCRLCNEMEKDFLSVEYKMMQCRWVKMSLLNHKRNIKYKSEGRCNNFIQFHPSNMKFYKYAILFCSSFSIWLFVFLVCVYLLISVM